MMKKKEEIEQLSVWPVLTLYKVFAAQETQRLTLRSRLCHKSQASLIEWCVSGCSPDSQDYPEACSALNPYIIDGGG